eukprot:1390023-Pleurochrysis_carterae.AAC.3
MRRHAPGLTAAGAASKRKDRLEQASSHDHTPASATPVQGVFTPLIAPLPPPPCRAQGLPAPASTPSSPTKPIAPT